MFLLDDVRFLRKALRVNSYFKVNMYGVMCMFRIDYFLRVSSAMPKLIMVNVSLILNLVNSVALW